MIVVFWNAGQILSKAFIWQWMQSTMQRQQRWNLRCILESGDFVSYITLHFNWEISFYIQIYIMDKRHIFLSHRRFMKMQTHKNVTKMLFALKLRLLDARSSFFMPWLHLKNMKKEWNELISCLKSRSQLGILVIGSLFQEWKIIINTYIFQ